MMRHALVVACAACGLMLATGCGRAVSEQEVAAWRTKYLLESEPADVMGILDLRESMADQTEADSVTLVGLIGGVETPWSEGHATFVIVDPMAAAGDDHAHHDHDHASAEHAHDHAHAHGHDHDHAHCAFCKTAAPNMKSLAMVQFTNEQGDVLPIDARRLFDLADNQAVVVRGKATVDKATGSTVVVADGLYVRR